MRKLLVIIIALLAGNFNADAQQNVLVEPPFWFTKMQMDSVLLMFDLSKAEAKDEVELTVLGKGAKVQWQRKDGDYLLAQLKLGKDLQPGPMPMQLKVGATSTPFTYNFRARTVKFAPAGISNRDVVYLVMPDRFCDGSTENNMVPNMEPTNTAAVDGRQGGDIQGIQQQLPYIKSLGVTAIWNTPLVEMNQAKGSYHHYGASNFYAIDPRFASGTKAANDNNEQYNIFVQKCHEQGLKVVMDVVLNHCGIDHTWCKNKAPKDWIHPLSICNFMLPALTDPYAVQVDIDSMEKAWFVPSMPDLNHDNAQMCQYLIQNTLWWIETSKIDALRLDTQPFSKKEFLTQWATAVKQHYPTINIVGETWSLLNTHQPLDYWQANSTAAYNSNIEQVMNFPWLEAMVNGLRDNDANKIYLAYAADFSKKSDTRYTFLSNHDTERFFTAIAEDNRKYEQAILMWASLPGIPQLYYGDELGFTGKKGINDGYMRATMPFFSNAEYKLSSTQNDKLNFCKKIIATRNSTEAWQVGKFTQRVPRKNVYAYTRNIAGNTYVFAFNFGNDKQNIDATFLGYEKQASKLRLEMHDEQSTATSIAGHGYVVFKVFE
jgi:neopullulanase